MKLQTILAVSTGVCTATLSHIEPRQAVGQAITTEEECDKPRVTLDEQLPDSYVLEDAPVDSRSATENLLRRFSSEPVDPVWSPRTASWILEKIANLGLALVSTEVECKTTVCRVHLTFPVEFVGKRPPAILLTAAMNGGALNREIPENELKTGLFSSDSTDTVTQSHYSIWRDQNRLARKGKPIR